MNVAQQNPVNLAEARVVRAAHRASGIVEYPGPVRVLEHERAIIAAKFAVVTAQRRNLHILRPGRRGANDCSHGERKPEQPSSSSHTEHLHRKNLSGAMKSLISGAYPNN